MVNKNKFWANFREWLSGILASLAIVSFLTSLAAFVTQVSTGDSLKAIPLAVVYGLAAAILISLITTFFVYLIKKRNAHISKIKREVVNAYMAALDQSSFNPHRLEDRYGRFGSSTTATK